MKEERQGCAGFDVKRYREEHGELKYEDVREYFRHYCLYGVMEGRVGT